MSRTFILASVAAVLIALTGTADQARAEPLGPAIVNEVPKVIFHFSKPYFDQWGKQAQDAIAPPPTEQPHFKFSTEQLHFKFSEEAVRNLAAIDEQTHAAIAASPLTAGEPQAPAFK